MPSQLRFETVGPDQIWRGHFIGPGGYPILATLDLGKAEQIARIRGEVDPLPPPDASPPGVLARLRLAFGEFLNPHGL